MPLRNLTLGSPGGAGAVLAWFLGFSCPCFTLSSHVPAKHSQGFLSGCGIPCLSVWAPNNFPCCRFINICMILQTHELILAQTSSWPGQLGPVSGQPS